MLFWICKLFFCRYIWLRIAQKLSFHVMTAAKHSFDVVIWWWVCTFHRTDLRKKKTISIEKTGDHRRPSWNFRKCFSSIGRSVDRFSHRGTHIVWKSSPSLYGSSSTTTKHRRWRLSLHFQCKLYGSDEGWNLHPSSSPVHSMQIDSFFS